MSDETPVRLYQAFVGQDPAAAIKVVEAARAAGVQQTQLFDTLFAPALALLGAAWACGEVDEVTFTQAAVVAEQITSFVAPPSAVADTGVTVLIGCMHKDRHAVVKNIVAAALKEAGNRVIDLGVDVRPAEFLEKVEETGARIVLVCAEILQTASGVGRVRDMFATAGHDDVVLLVAGGPFEADPQMAKRAGANGVVRGAESAIRLVARVAADRLGIKAAS
ncbi:MAG: cobalamin-dependent protein [Coriobacteriia bacterium]|nr:cobalamin-dependent protein [Coriobacteriia bacterium]